MVDDLLVEIKDNKRLELSVYPEDQGEFAFNLLRSLVKNYSPIQSLAALRRETSTTITENLEESNLREIIRATQDWARVQGVRINCESYDYPQACPRIINDVVDIYKSRPSWPRASFIAISNYDTDDW